MEDQGKQNQIWNNMFLYMNAFKEGWRADLTRFGEAPWSVGSKFIFYNVVPKIMMKLMEVGAFGMPVAAFWWGVNQWCR